MLQRVGECGAVTTKMLSHGLRPRWPSPPCEVCEASGQQPPVDETVAASPGLFQSDALGPFMREEWEALISLIIYLSYTCSAPNSRHT